MYKLAELPSKYEEKKMSPQEAAELVQDGDRISYGFGYTAPYAVDEALAERLKNGELKNIELVNTLSMHEPAVYQASENNEQIKFTCGHFSGLDRKHSKNGRCWFTPIFFRESPKYWAEETPADVLVIQATPMDKWGNFNIGPALTDIRGYLKGAKKVIVETNSKMPFVHGMQTELNLCDVDAVVEGNNPDIPEITSRPADEKDRKIAETVVDLIESGSTLQLGIGALPNMIGQMLCESDRTDLGAHTEMLTDAYVDLYEAGKLTSSHSSIPGKIVYAFAGGTKRLYDFLDHNQKCFAAPVSYVNDVHVISSIDKMISVNGAIDLDLFGQVNAESAGFQHISGTGGQLDFVQGAYGSRGGKSFICLHSTRQKKDGSVESLIKPALPLGSIVTTPRAAVHYVVTEYGAAELKGKSTWKRAEALINIAHPDFRDELIKDAEKMGIWTNTSKLSL
ncbi:MAG: acetyl-CoA hydrolase/transferase family protein [Eubacterium sp.]